MKATHHLQQRCMWNCLRYRMLPVQTVGNRMPPQLDVWVLSNNWGQCGGHGPCSRRQSGERLGLSSQQHLARDRVRLQSTTFLAEMAKACPHSTEMIYQEGDIRPWIFVELHEYYTPCIIMQSSRYISWYRKIYEDTYRFCIIYSIILK